MASSSNVKKDFAFNFHLIIEQTFNSKVRLEGTIPHMWLGCISHTFPPALWPDRVSDHKQSEKQFYGYLDSAKTKGKNSVGKMMFWSRIIAPDRSFFFRPEMGKATRLVFSPRRSHHAVTPLPAYPVPIGETRGLQFTFPPDSKPLLQKRSMCVPFRNPGAKNQQILDVFSPLFPQHWLK